MDGPRLAVTVLGQLGVQVVDQVPERACQQQREHETGALHLFIMAGIDRIDN
jgi:hypothetical protein